MGVRFSAKDKADALGIKGYARNKRDGSVFLELEGEVAVLREFIDWCKTSESSGNARDMAVSPGPIKGYREFQIY